MAARDRTATRWLLVVGLQLPALLTLQSCKNDQTEPVKGAAQHSDERAVFGSAPERNASDVRRHSSKTAPHGSQPTESTGSQERARTADPIVSKSPVMPRSSPRSPIKDPGERGSGDGGVQVGSNVAPRQSAAKRFLHYEPPGSSIGDTGELTSRTTEPQISASMKSIRDLIRRWADTLLAGDVKGHMSLYAATLERFHGSSNVGREMVRRYKQRLVPGLADVRRFEVYDVRLFPSRNGSVVTEFRVESDDAGLVGRHRLQMRQVDDDWKIFGEERLGPVSRRRGY